MAEADPRVADAFRRGPCVQMADDEVPGGSPVGGAEAGSLGGAGGGGSMTVSAGADTVTAVARKRQRLECEVALAGAKKVAVKASERVAAERVASATRAATLAGAEAAAEQAAADQSTQLLLLCQAEVVGLSAELQAVKQRNEALEARLAETEGVVARCLKAYSSAIGTIGFPARES